MKAASTSPFTAAVRSCRPHDLLWLDSPAALFSGNPLPAWVGEQWHARLPVVVRRDKRTKGPIPVGIRGKRRSERAAAWVSPDNVRRIVTPESLISDRQKLAASPFAGSKPVRAILELARLELPWEWGVTGSCAYALATGQPVMHEDSDLDILIRCPDRQEQNAFAWLAKVLDTLPCRTHIQIETPAGAFALKEWFRIKPGTGENGGGNSSLGQVLLKTDSGPVLCTDPWQIPLLKERDTP